METTRQERVKHSLLLIGIPNYRAFRILTPRNALHQRVRNLESAEESRSMENSNDFLVPHAKIPSRKKWIRDHAGFCEANSGMVRRKPRNDASRSASLELM